MQKKKFCHLYLLTHDSHLAIYGYGSVEDAMHAQDGRLGRVDDGSTKQGAKHATIADGERAPIHIFNCKFIVTSLTCTSQMILLFSELWSSLKDLKTIQ